MHFLNKLPVGYVGDTFRLLFRLLIIRLLHRSGTIKWEDRK